MSERDISKPPIGWWEDYACGCVSETVRYKKDLLGYCSRHGSSRRHVWPEYPPKESPNA